jgi:fructokinase
MTGLGEILWDLTPSGPQLGGAPANFAYHTHALGAQSYIVSRIGQDPLATQTLTKLAQLGLNTTGIQSDPNLPTGTVTVQIDPRGQPHYTIHRPVAWDAIEATPSAKEIVRQSNAICFGTLAQRDPRSRTALLNLIQTSPPTTLRILDVNLRQKDFSREIIHQSLQLANVLKINDAELPVITAMFNLTGAPAKQLRNLASTYHLNCVALTRGAQGSLLLTQNEISDHPGLPTQVADTIGAGDAFTAALAIGLLSKDSLDKMSHRANTLAAYVASQHGATPILPPNLQHQP